MGSSARSTPRAYVLDDEAGIRTVVCHILSGSGFAAWPFSSAQTLLNRLKHEPPELLVLDLALGHSDAVEVIQNLAALAYCGKVLLISGHEDATLREVRDIGSMRGLAMLQPLRKPFRSADLRSRLLAEPLPPLAVPPPTSSPVLCVDVSEALRNHWLELWYQPKVDLKSGRACGAEALLRVRHPEHGIIPPAGFLPPPNDPLYQPLSELVLRLAMQDWPRFAAAGFPLKLAVNMPASVISAPSFVTLIRQSLPQHPRFPGFIAEVTESEVVQNATTIKEVAAQLKLYGVSLSIDDFGSGYSSLSRLFELPFSEVKLDRSFVSNCGSDHLKAAVCQTAIDLAHRFEACVCAEGVESAEDEATLSAIGCDIAQGYYFARPMPVEKLVAHLRESGASDSPGSGSSDLWKAQSDLR